MNYDNIRKNCRVIRMVIGLALIIVGFTTSNSWFFLGAIPLVAGIANFCPLCMITKKCSIN